MELIIRSLGLQDYLPAWRAMQRFNERRDESTPDEIWFLEHPPVYTLGLNGNVQHILGQCGIPVVHTDRGGQVTYHGPGQLVVYVLIDLKRKQIGVRALVSALENAVVALLDQYGIPAMALREAPGVYVRGEKIASVGLRIRHGSSYHGLSLNVAMDLAPFANIHPCGYQGLKVTQLAALDVTIDIRETAAPLLMQLLRTLDYPGISAHLTETGLPL
jgi:lipoyl(octanoyl) transferase